MQQRQPALKPFSLAAAVLVAAAALVTPRAHALVKVSDTDRDRAGAQLRRAERLRPPSRPITLAKEGSIRRSEGEAGSAASAASLFRLVPSESWIPAATPPKKAARPSVGGFFGGFTE